MKNFLRAWTFKKHSAIVAVLYSALFSIGNAVFINKNIRKRNASKEKHSAKFISRGQKAFNGILAVCFALDLASYGLIKYYQKKLDQ